MKKYLLLFLIICFGLILRIINLNYQAKNYPHFYQPLWGTDMYTYLLSAKELAFGEEKKNLTETFIYIYKYPLAIFMKLANGDIYKTTLFQVLFFFPISCILFFIAGKYLFNWQVGILAALLCSIYGVLIVYEMVFLNDIMWAFCGLLFVAFFSIFVAKKKSLFLIISGVGCALTILARPNFLIPAVFSNLCFFFLKGKLKNKFKNIFIFNLSIVATFLFFFSLHYLIYKNPGFESPGVLTLCMGNNRYAKGWFEYPKNEQEIKELARKYKISYEDAMLLDIWLFFKEEPLRFLYLQLRKFFLFWDDWEMPNNIDYSQMRSYSYILQLFFILTFGKLAPFCIVGFFLSLKRKKVYILHVYFIFFMLSLIAVFICGRYRVAFCVALLLFSAFGLFKIFYFLKNKELKKFFMILSPLVLLFLFCNSHLFYSKLVSLFLLKTSIHEKTGKYISIRDDSGNWRGGEGIVLTNPNQTLKKLLVVKEIDWEKIKNCYLTVTLASNTKEGLLCVFINKKKLMEIPCINLPHEGLVGTGELPIPLSILKEGENLIEFKVKNNAAVFFPYDKYYFFKRSIFCEDSTSKILPGELRIELKMEL